MRLITEVRLIRDHHVQLKGSFVTIRNGEAVLNTKKIADRCDVDLQLGRILIPKFPVPAGEDEKTYLDRLVFQGLVHRYGGKTLKEVEKLEVPECRKILEKVDKDRDEIHKILPRIDYATRSLMLLPP